MEIHGPRRKTMEEITHKANYLTDLTVWALRVFLFAKVALSEAAGNGFCGAWNYIHAPGVASTSV